MATKTCTRAISIKTRTNTHTHNRIIKDNPNGRCFLETTGKKQELKCIFPENKQIYIKYHTIITY